MKKNLPFLFLVFAFLSCKKDNPDKIQETTLFPTEITQTASNTSDVVKLKYSYNAANQIIREDIFRNEALEHYSLFSYNPAGKLQFKYVYGNTGRFLEQNEMQYNGGELPAKLQHSYIDSAGNPSLHHYRKYVFNTDGSISRWTDLAPDNEIISSRVYFYKNNNVLESEGTGSRGEFLDKIVQTLDGKLNPFINTQINPIKLAGNELKMELKNETGQVVNSYINSFEYNEKGFPLKRTQTLNDGTVITETYFYKTE